jgi:uncharacterized protein YeaO (DUF488 family)
VIQVKRVYDPPAPEDGTRFLVERLWPRGVKKAYLKMEAWLKEVAPSAVLRRWWDAFQERYVTELDNNPEALRPLVEAARRGHVTLLYSARDTEHNSAVVLKRYLEKHLQEST